MGNIDIKIAGMYFDLYASVDYKLCLFFVEKEQRSTTFKNGGCS